MEVNVSDRGRIRAFIDNKVLIDLLKIALKFNFSHFITVYYFDFFF
jgi:hypothetical protein